MNEYVNRHHDLSEWAILRPRPTTVKAGAVARMMYYEGTGDRISFVVCSSTAEASIKRPLGIYLVLRFDYMKGVTLRVCFWEHSRALQTTYLIASCMLSQYSVPICGTYATKPGVRLHTPLKCKKVRCVKSRSRNKKLGSSHCWLHVGAARISSRNTTICIGVWLRF